MDVGLTASLLLTSCSRVVIVVIAFKALTAISARSAFSVIILVFIKFLAFLGCSYFTYYRCMALRFMCHHRTSEVICGGIRPSQLCSNDALPQIRIHVVTWLFDSILGRSWPYKHRLRRNSWGTPHSILSMRHSHLHFGRQTDRTLEDAIWSVDCNQHVLDNTPSIGHLQDTNDTHVKWLDIAHRIQRHQVSCTLSK